MQTHLSLAAIIRIIFALLLSAIALMAQGPLAPTAAPAPTMKSLQQIEPRTPLDANNAPGDADYHHIISSGGSYYLTGNLEVTKTHGIDVRAAGVTIDLNGFEIRRTAGAGGNGIEVDTTSHRCAVKNGAVSGFAVGLHWIFSGSSARAGSVSHLATTGCSNTGIKGGEGAQLEDCKAHDNLGGITAGNGSSLKSCSAYANEGFVGILAGAGSTLVDCVAYQNQTSGAIGAGAGSALTRCTATGNTTGSDVIQVGAGSTLHECTASSNTSGSSSAIKAGAGSVLINCTARANTVQSGIYAEGRSTLVNCSASDNTSSAVLSYGIYSPGESTISGCTAAGNQNTNGASSANTGVGIYAGNSSLVKDCTVAANKGDGIQVTSDSRVVGNTCDSNGAAGNGAGVHSTSADNRIEGNSVTDNVNGIYVELSGNLVIKNSAAGNGTNFLITANNKVGVIVLAPNSGAIGGSTGGAGVGTTDPWANLSF